MAKYKVRAGHTITMGPEKEGGPNRVFTAGQSVELSADEAKAAAHAIEKGEKTKTLRERREELEAQMDELKKDEAKQRKHARSPKGKKEREEALKSIEERPGNAASGQPSFGRVPDEHIAHLERLQEGEIDEGPEGEEAATEHGFGRERAPASAKKE